MDRIELTILRCWTGENALVRRSGNLDGESDRFSAIEEATLAPKRGMVLPFKQLSIAFHNVNYYVDMPAVSHFIFIRCQTFWHDMLQRRTFSSVGC